MIRKIVCFICIILLFVGSAALGEEWVCPNCNTTVSGNFCSECGTKKPSNEWICAQCGHEATGNFCSNCGSPRPAEATAVPERIDTRSQRMSGSKNTVEISQYQYKVSDYWIKDSRVEYYRAYAEKGEKTAMLTVQPIIINNYTVGFEWIDTDEERDSFIHSSFRKYNIEMLNTEVISDDDIKGVLWHLKMNINEKDAECYYLVFPSETDNCWVRFMCIFTDNTEYRYDEEFKDVIRSITKKQTSTIAPTAKPTKTPRPTATPKPTKTPKPTATPKPTRTPSTTDTDKTVRVKLSSGRYVIVRKSVKEALDAYESFMDGYKNALNQLSTGDFSGYLTFMEKYEEYTEKIDALEDDLTDDELLYYYEVIVRVAEKMY